MKGFKMIGLGLLAAAAVALAPSAQADPFGTNPVGDATIEAALCTNLFHDTTRGMMVPSAALDKGLRNWVAGGGDRGYVLAAYNEAAYHSKDCAMFAQDIMGWLNTQNRRYGS